MSDEFDLDILKTVKAPRPDAETRDRAMREALAAFEDEKKSAATQGSASGSRLMTILQRSWSTTMETLSKGRLMSGTAIATILAVPLAGYLAFMVMNDGYRPGLTGSQPMELAAGNADAEPAADLRSETRAQAEDAARMAANDAVVRMRAATRLDLAVELPGRTVAQTAGD